MITYSSKTKNGSTAQGKARVYVSAHPEDLLCYLDWICEEIWERADAAITYTLAEKAAAALREEEEHFFHLRQMKLLVLPVTQKLLTEDCLARRELCFAMEQHIPVLPLMMDVGLEKHYAPIFGELQFLDAVSKDETALQFSHKLTKYLQAVLIGEEKVNQVRNAFSAYVFLSYRKKDRRYATELMRLIHQHPACRDLAIWYDEFLVPGENFNDGIGAMLQKSSLCALVVTPHLICEDNYVMRIEYPMARQADKLVIPVEFVQTDRVELARCYEGIEPCVAAEATAVGERFAQAVAALPPTEQDAEHLFLMGLAYLGGIDVETDYARALSLLTAAAEQGSQEAIEKLVVMYEYGEGVGVDTACAIEWQKRLVAYLAQRAQESGEEAVYADLLLARLDLNAMEARYRTPKSETPADILRDGMQYLPTPTHPYAISCMIQLLKESASNSFCRDDSDWRVRFAVFLSEALKKRLDNGYSVLTWSESMRFRARYTESDEEAMTYLRRAEESLLTLDAEIYGEVWRELGEVCFDMGDRCGDDEQAKAYYDRSVAMFVAAGALSDAAMSCEWLGDAAMNEDEFEEAKRYYRMGIDILLPKCEKEASRYERQRLASLYEQLRRVHRACSEQKEEQQTILLCIGQYRTVAEEYPFPDHIRTLKQYVRDREQEWTERREPTEAIGMLNQWQAILQQFPERENVQEELCFANRRMAYLLLMLGDTAFAEVYANKAEDGIHWQCNAPERIVWHVVDQERLWGDLLTAKGAFDEALWHYVFVTVYGSAMEEFYVDVSGAFQKIGEWLVKQGALREAKAIFTLAAMSERGDCSMEGDTPCSVSRRKLTQYTDNTDVLFVEENYALYRHALARVRELWDESAKEENTKWARWRCFSVRYAQALLHDRIGQHREAYGFYEEALAWERELIGRRALAKRYEQMGILAAKWYGNAEALAWYGQAEEILASLYASDAQKEHKRMGGNAYAKDYWKLLWQKGKVLKGESPTAAIPVWERALAIALENDENPFELPALYEDLGTCYFDIGQFEEARMQLMTAEILHDSAVLGEPTLSLYLPLCLSYCGMGEVVAARPYYQRCRDLLREQMENCFFFSRIGTEEDLKLYVESMETLLLLECAAGKEHAFDVCEELENGAREVLDFYDGRHEGVNQTVLQRLSNLLEKTYRLGERERTLQLLQRCVAMMKG